MKTTVNAISTTGLVKHRGDFTLGPLDLHVPRGFVTGMVGANGAGKTTSLRTMLGLFHADAGTVEIPEMDDVGVAFDQPFILSDWRIREACDVYAMFRPGWDPPHVAELLNRLGIQRSKRVKDLSHGEQNKLMLAFALGNHPQLLILDEPTSGLDPASRADVVDLLREYMSREDTSLLFSTHITSDLENFADHLILLDRGRTAYQGPLDRVVEEFAYIHGAYGDLTATNIPLIHGLRRRHSLFDGIIDIHASAAFGPAVHLEPPTLEQIAVHLTHFPGSEEN